MILAKTKAGAKASNGRNAGPSARDDVPVTLLCGARNTSTASVTVFIGVNRCSRSSMAMKSGGASPVAAERAR